MAEFQSGETVGVTHGGTGLSSLGSSLQVLRVNAAGNALEFGTLEDLGDIGSIGSTLTAPSNADFTITTAGTGNIILNDLSIIDNTLTTNRSNDDLKINASGSGTVVLENLKVGTSGATVTTILDEDAMGSDSATALATQQSIKAYVDNEVGNVSTTSISQGDSNVTVADSGTGNITIEVDGTDRITTVAATTTTATGHSLVIGAASNSAGGQIKFLEGTDNGTNGVTVQGPSSTADVTVTLPSSAGTLALTSDITFTASSTDTLTNKTFDVEGTGNSISNIDVADLKSGVLDTDLSSVSGSDDTLASAKAIKSYVDSQVTAQDLDFSADDSTVLSIDLDSEVLHFAGGTGISTSVSNNTVTHAIDTGTVVSVSDTQTLTNKTLTSPIIDTGVSGTAILDEDNMSSNSATKLATQQSIKAYVDAEDANIASDTLTFTNKTFDVEGTGNSISNIDVADFKSGVLDTDLSSVSGSDDTLASAKAIKSYVDSQVTAQDLDFATDDSTALNIDLDSETLQFSGGNGINTRGSNNTVTIDIDTGTVVTLSDSQTLTNKVLTNPTINAFSGTGNGSITGTLSIDNTTTDDSLLITSTEDSNTAAPVITLKRNSGSPADADYLGRINFKGENDADQGVTYARLSGKIIDASDGTEDGAIEISTMKEGTTTITARFRSDKLQILNGTEIDVDGAGTFAGAVTATSLVTNDIVSNGSNAELTVASSGTGDIILDAGGDVIVDVDNADLILKDDGIEFGRLSRVTADFVIKASAQDKDLVFKGNDGGATVTALTLDMSDAGAATFNSTLVATHITATSVTTNDIVSNGSNANINLTPAGTGTVAITTDATVGDDLSLVSDAAVLNFGSDSEIKLTHVHDTGLLLTDSGGTPTLQLHDANESIASDGSKVIITSGGTTFNLPTADGTSGQALVTDGAGTLSFDTVSSGAVSDDTLVTVRNNKNLNASARTIDSFNTTFTDSAWYMLVQNDLVNEVVSTQCFAVSNNDTASFISASRGIESAGGSNMPTLTTDVSNTMVRLRAAGSSAECKTSFYKIPLSSANTADATRGNTVTTSNTDVDSASESIDTFAHATYRGAKYFISIDNDSKTEVDTIEALVVHDGSNAFITSYGGARTGNNDLLTLTADIVSDNVVVSAAGLEPNLNLTIHKILLKDNMTAESNTNQKAFASVTVSSSATAIDTFDLDDANGAVYYIVSKNATEGSFAISEVFAAAAPGVPSVAEGPQVSTKSTPLIEFSAAFDTATENSFELFASSTAGGSTTVSGYRISALAG